VATKPAAPTNTPAPAATPSGGRGPLTVAANDPDVDGKMVSYKSDTEMIAYLARPKKEGTYPAVLVIHENRGLQEHVKDVARRLAKAGFIALAPDLVSRSGGSEKLGFDPIAGVLGAAKPEDLVKDLSAGIDYLMTQAGVKAGKVGVVGFCFGGGYTLRLAGANPKVTAAVPYYGPSPTPPTLVASTNAAILAHYGGTDTRVNAGIPDLEAAMKAAGKTFEKRIWEGAPHAFNNDTGGNFNETAAVGAWKETLAWFAKYL
jgi:carboxymethylenebutenolidase